MSAIKSFFHVAKSGLQGSSSYRSWLAFLSFWITIGVWAYLQQLEHGLAVTGMHDHVSWGLYISNFTFLVGLAAASVMLVLPCYILKQIDFKQAVIIGEGVAVAALIMCLCFVVADMGSPQNLWHMIPGLGRFNWPSSMLTWDVIVLNGYLALNICIPAYLLYCRFHNVEPSKKYVFFVYLSVFWAIAIHLVTAFLYAGLPARPFWNSSLLGPRFLASAFAGGPAFIIMALLIIRSVAKYAIRDVIIQRLALVATIAAQINLIMLGSELFKEFYAVTHHSHSAKYLFFGLDGHNALVPWIWSAISMNILATIILSVHKLRNQQGILFFTCALLFIAIWIEKGFGLIVPGFIPSPLGEIAEYTPSLIEVFVTIGIWALGLFIFTYLANIAIRIEKGELNHSND